MMTRCSTRILLRAYIAFTDGSNVVHQHFFFFKARCVWATQKSGISIPFLLKRKKKCLFFLLSLSFIDIHVYKKKECVMYIFYLIESSRLMEIIELERM